MQGLEVCILQWQRLCSVLLLLLRWLHPCAHLVKAYSGRQPDEKQAQHSCAAAVTAGQAAVQPGADWPRANPSCCCISQGALGWCLELKFQVKQQQRPKCAGLRAQLGVALL